MRSGLAILFAAVISLVMASGAFAVADWTLMVYLNADNNLHNAGLDDINEMEWCDVPTNGSVKIIVLFDGQYSGDSKIYDIQHDPNGYDSTIISTVVDDGNAVVPASNECDMDDIDTLENFVMWTQANYPANNYLMSLWDHGSGIFKGPDGKIVNNYSPFRGCVGDLKLWEVDGVFENAVDSFDIVGFDVCLLGHIETGYQLEMANVDYVIASEKTEPGDGWDYFAFDMVCDSPGTTPRNLAINIVDMYLDFYSGETQAGQDLTYLNNTLEGSLNTLCEELRLAMYANESTIVSARNSAWSDSYNPDCKDMYEFTTAIENASSLPTSLKNAAADFNTKWATFIIAGGLHNSYDVLGGARVYFPSNGSADGDWSSYISNLNFTNTQWDEFLLMYADPYPMLPNYFTYTGAEIDDSSGGDGDGVAEPGETVDITVSIKNDGTDTANSVSGTLSTTNTYITVNTGTASFGNIAAGSTGTAVFNFTVGASCPEWTPVNFDLAMTSSTKYSQNVNFGISVGWGFNDDVEGSLESLYTIESQWHEETNRSHSPDTSWKCGGNGSGDYGDNLNCSLTTPTINVPTDSTDLTFWTWYNLETSYDYGYVEVSTNGSSWTQLGARFNGSSGWGEETRSLSSYAGESVYLRFRMTTDVNTTEEGWYVDDIVVGGVASGADDENNDPSIPSAFSLNSAYPNPSKDSVNFSFALPIATNIELAVYDLKGRKIDTVMSGNLEAGNYEIPYSNSLAAGVYIYKLTTDNNVAAKKLVVVK